MFWGTVTSDRGNWPGNREGFGGQEGHLPKEGNEQTQAPGVDHMDQKWIRKRTGGGVDGGEPQGERDIPPQSGPGRFSRFFRLFPAFTTNKKRPKRSFSIKNTHTMHVFDQGGSYVDHFGTHLLPVCFLHIHPF